ncbi:hypothetical protein [Testudinibacter sp. TR-2022]|uniref:hypothetical protein n=1 Tax=Testudinibacter sp. TR-2022 TaxID=2585029 RepID=UPI00111945F1|nr:hypothetical protein [Testudinibacter sp. TR-2022]TNH05933.1 hypothetical protein FHQ30_09590 [Pasteurellaceae bacterium Phil11]TNH23254.1 hypothetical protein FHQ29_05995 [Testudinibacter sp. TR-2022]TNH29140.1 hypothetical protein FHQ27_01000 [Testudinibacter sp. TR-2022]
MQAEINLLDWRSKQLDRQMYTFIIALFAVLCLAALVLWQLFDYQQLLQQSLSQQSQAQATLRAENQRLQQQINQLQQANSSESAVFIVPDQTIFNRFSDFLSRLPLSQGRLSSASISVQPPFDYQILLQGSTPSEQEFEQLRHSFEPYFAEYPLLLNHRQHKLTIKLEQFDLNHQQLEFHFALRWQRAKTEEKTDDTP